MLCFGWMEANRRIANEGNFRGVLNLTMRARLCAWFLLWKLVFIHAQTTGKWPTCMCDDIRSLSCLATKNERSVIFFSFMQVLPEHEGPCCRVLWLRHVAATKSRVMHTRVVYQGLVTGACSRDKIAATLHRKWSADMSQGNVARTRPHLWVDSAWQVSFNKWHSLTCIYGLPCFVRKGAICSGREPWIVHVYFQLLTPLKLCEMRVVLLGEASMDGTRLFVSQQQVLIHPSTSLIQ